MCITSGSFCIYLIEDKSCLLYKSKYVDINKKKNQESGDVSYSIQ